MFDIGGFYMNFDCGFTKESNWFRYRVGAIIINGNSVLLAKNELDPYYYSVGGAVHMGESAEDAVKREVFEETGIHFEIDRLVFIHENFFKGSSSLDGYNCHEIAFYYLMKPNKTQTFSKTSFAQGGILEKVHWLPIDNLKNYEAYPIFFADKLKNIPNHIEHIITHEN